MRIFGREKSKRQLPESKDKLKDADAETKIRYTLDLWKTRSNGHFKYDCTSRGMFSFPFRGVMISISVDDIHELAICRVIPQHPLPSLKVKYPLSSGCLELFAEWCEKRIYSNLAFLEDSNEKDKDHSYSVITTRACLSAKHITPASVLHALTEIADGYWQLARAFQQSGSPSETISSFAFDGRIFLESLLKRVEDVQMGVLTGKLAKQMLPDDFSSLLKKEVVPLPFLNLIGDQEDTMDKLGEYIQARASEMGTSPERASSLVGAGHIDMYSIRSEYIGDFIPWMSELLRQIGKDFQLETIHQGFPSLPHQALTWDRKVFLAIRYLVKLADVKDVDVENLQEWRNSMLFLNRPKIPIHFKITAEQVGLLVTLPFILEEKANFAYPEFYADNLTYSQEDITCNWEEFAKSARLKERALEFDKWEASNSMGATKIARATPNNAGDWVAKGRTLGELGKHNEALECFQAALEVDPTFVKAHFYKGIALDKLKRVGEAKESWKTFVRLAPPEEISRIELARKWITETQG